MITEIPAKFSTRVIGRFGGQHPGPLVVSVGGQHGNEPAGIFASRNVLQQLASLRTCFRGEYVALAGNLSALRLGVRYVDEDLNRIWRRDLIRRAESASPEPGSVEEAELRALLAEIRVAVGRCSDEAYFIDLHTTSASGSPFVVVADTLLNRRLAQALPAPMVLGLEEYLSGTLLNFVNDLGHVAVGFEGGQHDSAASVAMLELGIWQTLRLAGSVDPVQVPGAGRITLRVRRRFQGSPSVLEIRHRHGVQPGDAFVMEPGFENLTRVRQGDVLAHDQQGPIESAESGLVLMPLYQTLGDDGYFLVRQVWPFWLEVSAWMRRLRMDRLLPLLPGVERQTKARDTLRVNPRVARWLVVQIFHLLGFRRQGSEHGSWIFSRRVEHPRPAV